MPFEMFGDVILTRPYPSTGCALATRHGRGIDMSCLALRLTPDSSGPASRHPPQPSTCRSHPSSWFQLAKMRLTRTVWFASSPQRERCPAASRMPPRTWSNPVDCRGISVETTSLGKREQLNGLAPEVAHHQSLSEIAPLEFNPRLRREAGQLPPPPPTFARFPGEGCPP